jgi:hypothetical protein
MTDADDHGNAIIARLGSMIEDQVGLSAGWAPPAVYISAKGCMEGGTGA